MTLIVPSVALHALNTEVVVEIVSRNLDSQDGNDASLLAVILPLYYAGPSYHLFSFILCEL
jgi:hypothetical protein